MVSVSRTGAVGVVLAGLLALLSVTAVASGSWGDPDTMVPILLLTGLLGTVALLLAARHAFERLAAAGVNVDRLGLAATLLLGVVIAVEIYTGGPTSTPALVAFVVLAPIATAFAVRQR